MEVHGIRSQGPRKEIQCEDCAHVYLIAEGQQSSRCDVCGNIAFHGSSAEPLRDLARGPMEVLREKVLARMAPALSPEMDAHPLAAFRKTADGAGVQRILVQYQVEWQLWAMVVKHFRDPVYHTAYLSSAALAGELDKAAERYREHRGVMALLRDDRWQADVAELMLSRLEALAAVQARAESRKGFQFLRYWNQFMLADSRALRFGWIVLGMAVLFRLLLAK